MMSRQPTVSIGKTTFNKKNPLLEKIWKCRSGKRSYGKEHGNFDIERVIERLDPPIRVRMSRSIYVLVYMLKYINTSLMERENAEVKQRITLLGRSQRLWDRYGREVLCVSHPWSSWADTSQ